MCYILYGAMDRSVNVRDYEQVSQRHTYRFSLGTRHDVKMCIVNSGDAFRVTDWICDCDFPVGKGDENAPELKELAGLILDLKRTRDAKCLYLAKAWNGKRHRNEVTVHVDDIDLIPFLANMEENCLYRLDLYPKYQ